MGVPPSVRQSINRQTITSIRPAFIVRLNLIDRPADLEAGLRTLSPLAASGIGGRGKSVGSQGHAWYLPEVRGGP